MRRERWSERYRKIETLGVAKKKREDFLLKMKNLWGWNCVTELNLFIEKEMELWKDVIVGVSYANCYFCDTNAVTRPHFVTFCVWATYLTNKKQRKKEREIYQNMVGMGERY